MKVATKGVAVRSGVTVDRIRGECSGVIVCNISETVCRNVEMYAIIDAN